MNEVNIYTDKNIIRKEIDYMNEVNIIYSL